MEIRYQNECDYKDWNRFIETEKSLNIWGYTLPFLKQCGVRNNKIDRSFCVIENDEVLGLCIVYIVDHGKFKTISNDGGFLRAPIVSSLLSRRKSEKVLDYVFETIDQIALEQNVNQMLLFYDPQPLYIFSANKLLKYGFYNASINTQLIDLSTNDSDIKKDFRKSYKSLINKGIKTYEYEVMNKNNPDYSLHEIYRFTHIKAAGFNVYKKEIYDSQFEQLVRGEATLIAVKYKNKYVQLNYFNHMNGYVYYASAADDPNFSETCDVPLGHGIMWFAIQHFKNCGYHYFELGWQSISNQIYDIPNYKDKAISYFKNGFGGEPYSLYRGVKYYNDSFKTNDITRKIDHLITIEANRLEEK